MGPLDSRAPPSANDLRDAFHSPSVTSFLELAARDIVRRNKHLVMDSKGHAIYNSRMNATKSIDAIDPQRPVPVPMPFIRRLPPASPLAPQEASTPRF